MATFATLFASILLLRNSKMGLLLSEFGSCIAGYAHAPASTKRLSNLLRSKKWEASLIDALLAKPSWAWNRPGSGCGKTG